MLGGVGWVQGGHLIHGDSTLVDKQSEEMRESRRKGCVCSDCLFYSSRALHQDGNSKRKRPSLHVGEARFATQTCYTVTIIICIIVDRVLMNPE